ncbi:hypothetical protein [Bathycoccus sp. RCC716 virus 1]|uniref:Major capsid protein n=1 Tax=Bathycoccus sp. RCC716 virus 1 TaxID=2530038 RepID=A0A7S6NXZ4_9PHYC|nr:hypothetical protein [Bathycoccus sp. RCC716 virus 1]
MAGGLMQLVAYGAQDVYLTGNPKVTFFQAVYKRHTNFAMETIEQTVNGTAGNNGRVSVTVARNGDLIADMYVELRAFQAFDTTEDAWVAESAISSVELSIGGQRIDKHYQKWWRLYSELYLDESTKLNYGKMTSATVDNEKVYLPLIFFFNRNPGLALPLIALQYHEVRIDFDLSGVYETNFDSFKVWGNYIYLDTEERRRFAQKGHEYLIEQVQHTGSDSLAAAGSTKQIRLSYNHPVKELVWCATESSNVVGDLNGIWNFTDTEVTVSSALGAVAASNVAIAPGAAGAPSLIGLTQFDEETSGPLDSFKLVLNGQDRFKEQGGKYFNSVQPYVHHSASPMPGVYAYSFALKPEEHQPTGTCNFSRIDNAQVSIATKTGSDKTTLHMFATNYNVLRIQSGMGGLAFSN